LTEFDSPAPEKYYFGQAPARGRIARPLRTRLIDGPGKTRSAFCAAAAISFAQTLGCRAAGQEQQGGRPVLRHRPAGWRRAAVRIPFEIPRFSGPAATDGPSPFSAHKVGSGVASMIVPRPRGDDRVLLPPLFSLPVTRPASGVTINNLEGAAGDYHLAPVGERPLRGFAIAVKPHRAPRHRPAIFADGFVLSATTPGNAGLRLELSGPGGLKIARDFTIGVPAGASLPAAPVCRPAAAGGERHPRRRPRAGRILAGPRRRPC